MTSSEMTGPEDRDSGDKRSRGSLLEPLYLGRGPLMASNLVISGCDLDRVAQMAKSRLLE